jgi:hypothetical protein
MLSLLVLILLVSVLLLLFAIGSVAGVPFPILTAAPVESREGDDVTSGITVPPNKLRARWVEIVPTLRHMTVSSSKGYYYP